MFFFFFFFFFFIVNFLNILLFLFIKCHVYSSDCLWSRLVHRHRPNARPSYVTALYVYFGKMLNSYSSKDYGPIQLTLDEEHGGA